MSKRKIVKHSYRINHLPVAADNSNYQELAIRSVAEAILQELEVHQIMELFNMELGDIDDYNIREVRSMLIVKE